MSVPKRSHTIRSGLVILFLALIALTVVILLNTNTPNQRQLTDTNDVVVVTTDSPDETLPNQQTYRWEGKQDEPKLIKIPSIGVLGFIQKMGVDQFEQVASPTNIHLAGWFIQSVKPGQPGLGIINGHVDGRRSPGIFKDLPKMEKGEEIAIQLGDGRVVSYVVLGVKEYEKDSAHSALFSQDPSVSSQLNIITCSGNFLPEQDTYDKRTIVTATLKNDAM